jgi:hypothetical protein
MPPKGYKKQRGPCPVVDCESAQAIKGLCRKHYLKQYHVKTTDMLREQRYGLSAEDYRQMLERQGGLCAICLQAPHGYALHIDHCHATGRVRGLLCRKCNMAIGLFADNPDRLQRAIEYLI